MELANKGSTGKSSLKKSASNWNRVKSGQVAVQKWSVICQEQISKKKNPFKVNLKESNWNKCISSKWSVAARDFCFQTT